MLLMISPIACFANSNLSVSVTMPPLHSIVSLITDGVVSLNPIFKGYTHHDNYLRPKDVEILVNSKIIFYMDDIAEPKIKKLKTEAKKIPLSTNCWLLPARSGSVHYQYKKSNSAQYDSHIWLSPTNVGVMLKDITNTLSEYDPNNQSRYKSNLDKALNRLESLIQDMRYALDNYKSTPYIVVHDTYRYLEKDLEIASPSGILISSNNHQSSVKNTLEVIKLIKEGNVKCVLSDIENKQYNSIFKPYDVTTVSLDPEGIATNFMPKDSYFLFIETLVTDIADCLSQ